MYALKYPHAGYIRAYQTECFCGCAEAVTVHSRSGRNLARHRPKKIFDRNYVSNCAARVSRYGRSRKLSVLALEWNGVADTTSLFQKYSLRKGRPATDYADVIGPRIERLMLFPKFELVEQPRSRFVSLPIFSGRDFALLRVAYSGLETAFITADRLIRKNRRGIGENDDRRVSLLGLRLPVIDDRDGRGGAFVHGEIHQESLAIGRHGVLLPITAR